jgi:hypothetical protein
MFQPGRPGLHYLCMGFARCMSMHLNAPPLRVYQVRHAAGAHSDARDGRSSSMEVPNQSSPRQHIPASPQSKNWAAAHLCLWQPGGGVNGPGKLANC